MYLGHDQKYPFNKLCRGSVKKLKNHLQPKYFILDHSLNIHSISLFGRSLASSFVLHFWNHQLSKDFHGKLEREMPLYKIFEKHCPMTLEYMKGEF